MLLGVMVTLQVLVLSLRVRISQEHPIYRCSSVGRVLGLGPRCRRFEPCHLYKQQKMYWKIIKFLTEKKRKIIEELKKEEE